MSADTAFSTADIQALDVELKIGMLATINPDGLPHLTMLSSLRPYAPNSLVFGQFTEGISKQHVRTNPRTGFLIMSLDKKLWRGTALFSHTARSGPEYDNYNNQPMFRYNAYFGVHTVYYLDLVALSRCEQLPMARVIAAALASRAAVYLGKKKSGPAVLNPWTRSLFDKLDHLKFLSYIHADGFPVIIPIIQTQSLDDKRLLFSSGVYTRELADIPVGASVAVYGMAFSMETVLVRGGYQGLQRVGGVRCGVVEVDWVYNAMPPTPGQIYPPAPLTAVRGESFFT